MAGMRCVNLQQRRSIHRRGGTLSSTREVSTWGRMAAPVSQIWPVTKPCSAICAPLAVQVQPAPLTTLPVLCFASAASPRYPKLRYLHLSFTWNAHHRLLRYLPRLAPNLRHMGCASVFLTAGITSHGCHR